MPTVLVRDLIVPNQEQKFELNSDEIIYEGLERQGVNLPHGCLSGSCGACRVIIVEGVENMKEPSVIESDTINHIKNNLAQKNGDQSYLTKNIRLSCRAKIRGDITIGKL